MPGHCTGHSGSEEVPNAAPPSSYVFLPARPNNRLALPMRHRGELAGVMLMAGKPSGDPYRPDEQELLGWAAHQVGLDLQALETEQLQGDVSRLKQEGASLTAQLELVRELGLKSAAKPG